MDKRKLSAIVLSLLFAIVIFFPFDAFSAMKGTVTADVLNVRSTNSLNGQIIGTVKKNTQLTIIKESGDWLEIEFQSKRAYVNKQYVKYPINTTTSRKVTIFVNNEQLALPTEPINQNSRLLVPYRILAESLGIKVEWDQALRQVTATDNKKKVILTIGKAQANVNGQTVQLDVAPIIVQSHTLVPLRFFSEIFDAEVEWDNATRTVTINRMIEQAPIDEPTDQPEQIEETDLIGTVIASVLNVRSGPSTEASKIGELTRGTKIKVVKIDGEWLKFYYKNQTAYVHKNYVNVQKDEEQIPINPIDALKNKTIVVDPGHGGSDPGTVHHGLREKDIVLNVGLLLEKKLKESGANVVMTRRDDRYVSLEQRSNIANSYNTDTFVSIHVNSVENVPTANGTETYWNRTYSSEQSRKLAQAIQKQLIEKLQTRDRGVKEANFYVIRYTKSPSVLVELGFLSNEEEAKRLNDPAFQELAAEAIFQGLIDYYSN